MKNVKKVQEAVVEEKPVQEAAPAPKKTVLKKPAVKRAAKAAPAKAEEVYVQFGDGEWKTADLLQKARDAYVAEGHRAANIHKLALYVKPEERKAYYVVNDKSTGSIEF